MSLFVIFFLGIVDEQKDEKKNYWYQSCHENFKRENIFLKLFHINKLFIMNSKNE